MWLSEEKGCGDGGGGWVEGAKVTTTSGGWSLPGMVACELGAWQEC